MPRNLRSLKGRKAVTLVSIVLLLFTTSASAELVNISTRALVENNLQSAVAGFIIDAADPLNPNGQQCVVVRGRGPSTPLTVAKLENPYLELRVAGGAIKDQNDNWQEHPFWPVIEELGYADLASGGRLDDLDAAIYICLDPGSYTAQLKPNPNETVNNDTGVGMIEVVKASYRDTSNILSVILNADPGSVLAGDYLDLVPAPSTNSGTTYTSSTKTLNVSTTTVTSAATWADMFEAGNKYDIQVSVTGFSGSNIVLKSGGATLMTINGNGSYEARGVVAGQDLMVTTNGGSSAALAMNVRDIISVSWDVSGATSCDTYDNNSFGASEWESMEITPDGDGNASGSIDFTANFSSETEFVYGLWCTDGARQASKESTVNASFCLGAGSVTVKDWADLNFGSGVTPIWPNPSGNTAIVFMKPETTVSVRFNTGTAGADDLYGAMKNPEVAGSGQLRDISISSCPGQFDNLALRCKSTAVSSGQVLYDIDNSRPELTSVCRLDDNKTYYFNVKFRDGCGGGALCETKIMSN